MDKIRSRCARQSSLTRKLALGCVATTLAISAQAQPARPAAAAAPAATAPAASNASTGTITGRVYNPITKQYVKDAEVSIRGTDRVVYSEDDGTFQLNDVPAGAVTVEVRYTGYDISTADLTVSGGRIATRDFEITSTAYKSQLKAGEDVIQLSEFVVSSEREGNAKAIQDQKRSMNISNIVASDIFGDVAEGNVGEFLKYMPGVDLEYVEADTRTPRLRGMESQYVGVTMDGMRMASADAFAQYNGSDNTNAGSTVRSFSFEQVSINSLDFIEVNYTNSADQDADTPAGSINMKTKRAFERKGRRVVLQANVMANGEDLTIKKTYGPDDRKNYKLRPGGMFEYSDVFLNNRLGIVLNLSESNMYNQQRLTTYTWSTAPQTATDTRPLVLTGLSFKDGPKFTERSAATFTADFKATSRLTLSLNAVGNYYFGTINNRTVGVTIASPLNAVTPAPNAATQAINNRAAAQGDGITEMSGPASVTAGSVFLRKKTNGITLTPRFEYKLRSLTVDGAFQYSRSTNSYMNAIGDGVVRDTPAGNLTGLTVQAQRSGGDTVDWHVIQTAGPDWANLANYRAGATAFPGVSDDGRYARDEIYQAQGNATYKTSWRMPTTFKTGAKVTEQYHDRENRQPWHAYNWVGGPNAAPGAGLGGNWAAFPSQHVFDMGHGSSFVGLNGGAPIFASRNDIADYFMSHRDEFTSRGNAANYAAAWYENHREVMERFTAFYLQAETKIKRLQVRGGVRYELTETESKQFLPLSNPQVRAAGFPTANSNNPNSDPTTVEGMIYKFTTLPYTKTTGDYDNIFPSLSLKYNVSANLQAQFGYSATIGRPTFDQIADITDVNETNLVVTRSDPNLKPETANNFTARLSYYFEPVGSLAVSAFENSTEDRITDITVDRASFDPAFGDPFFDTYTFQGKGNAQGTSKFRGWMLEYRQALSFLPKPFSGMGIFANYTRNYYLPSEAFLAANPTTRRELRGMVPHTVSGGLTFKSRRITADIKAKWTDVTPFGTQIGRYRKQRTMVDIGAAYQITAKINAFVSGRNVFNVPDYVFDNGDPLRLNKIEYYGTLWTAGVKATF